MTHQHQRCFNSSSLLSFIRCSNTVIMLWIYTTAKNWIYLFFIYRSVSVIWSFSAICGKSWWWHHTVTWIQTLTLTLKHVSGRGLTLPHTFFFFLCVWRAPRCVSIAALFLVANVGETLTFTCLQLSYSCTERDVENVWKLELWKVE